MTPIALDLHTHTPHILADYRGPADTTPRAIVEAALAAGLSMLAVTDHFSVDYVDHLREAARLHAQESGQELVVLPGVEIRVVWGKDEVHLVALLPPESYRVCFEELARGFGIDGRTLELEELPTVRVHAHPCTVAERVAELGGMCHIAHADRYFGAYRFLDTPFFEEVASHHAVAAVDLVDPSNEADVRRRIPGVRIISSSDAHSPAEIGRRRATLLLEEPSFESLCRALDSGSPPGAGVAEFVKQTSSITRRKE